MGVSVRQKDGAWWLFVHHHGRRKAKRIGPGDEGRKAATQAAKLLAAKLALGDLSVLPAEEPAAPVLTGKAVIEEWQTVTAPAWKKGTQITYDSAIRTHLIPPLGALPITAWSPARIEEWWGKLRAGGYSKKTLSCARSILRGVCRRAVSKGYLVVNPADAIEGRLGRSDTESRRADYLVQDDLTKMLETARTLAPREYPILLVMAGAGLRLGEALGVQVGDLDTESRQLHIRRTVRRAYISSPKNGKGRVVDIPAQVADVLKQLREVRQVEAAVEGKEARWMFLLDEREMPFAECTVRRAMHRVLKAAGIRKVSPHALRHGYATLAIQAGVPLLAVSRQLGHSSISLTADIYCHAIPGGNRAAADVLETILTGNQMQPPRNLLA